MLWDRDAILCKNFFRERIARKMVKNGTPATNVWIRQWRLIWRHISKPGLWLIIGYRAEKLGKISNPNRIIDFGNDNLVAPPLALQQTN